MSKNKQVTEETNSVLVKLRPRNALRAAESRANLRPLYDTPRPTPGGFGLDATAQWFLADLPDGAATPWDLAHSRVGAQLGVAESDVVFAEPDFVHRDVYRDANEEEIGPGFAAGDKCEADPQDAGGGKPPSPAEFAWHLGDDYTQLRSARDEVVSQTRAHASLTSTPAIPLAQDDARTRAAPPRTQLRQGETERNSAETRNRLLLLDNSGHGTGTIGILAGRRVPPTPEGRYLGGAPHAEILPLRVSDSVVLLRTSALARALNYAVEQRCDVVTLSMGGVPSEAWAEAVDRAYEAGVVICAAAGNHVGFTPPHVVVYPARYSRVIAVCGVMANHKPYTGLKGTTLECSSAPLGDEAASPPTRPTSPAALMCGERIRLTAGPPAATAGGRGRRPRLEKYKSDCAATGSASMPSATPFTAPAQGDEALRQRRAPGLRGPQVSPSRRSRAASRIILGHLAHHDRPRRLEAARSSDVQLDSRARMPPGLQDMCRHRIRTELKGRSCALHGCRRRRGPARAPQARCRALPRVSGRSCGLQAYRCRPQCCRSVARQTTPNPPSGYPRYATP